MTFVTVTVKLRGQAHIQDLQVSSALRAAELAEMVVQALNWPDGSYDIEVYQSGQAGHMLQPDETLAQANAWDGSWLVFHPHKTSPPSPLPLPQDPPLSSPAGDSPVIKWRKV